MWLRIALPTRYRPNRQHEATLSLFELAIQAVFEVEVIVSRYHPIKKKYWTGSGITSTLSRHRSQDSPTDRDQGAFVMDTLKKLPTRADAYVRSGIEPLIDTEEAAALLQIHPRTLQRMARRGEVRGYQLGKLWRFRASDLLEGFSAMPFKLVS